MTLGTGCGVGIVVNGQIVEGPRASAGEVFLARVGDRNYDEAISGTGLERLWREIHGDDTTLAWLEGLAANDAESYANNTAIVQAVGRGDVPLGLVNHYYNYRARAEDPGLASENYFFPDGDVGSLLIASTSMRTTPLLKISSTPSSSISS